ncbi:hypothetical protein HYPSUDRAFT_85257 [Hypholoma sublateritium FD-334 SS-4]|uniref:NAD-dependent epimerase/dehydratase domain-containing protein n=1 Tax=Hypholoma sublateritium (strain FD-334 SS-4) TaxID=945553 RepID=A0A0D2Q1T3_HYPSF|nr:hypothetical protein HYPSUDRAFT_85257 [Hypholoma sublateritium FD-334 SS-4]
MSKIVFVGLAIVCRRAIVTGASGFLGSHIVSQLLDQGYRVRAAARGKKVEVLKILYSAHPSVEVVEIADLVAGHFGGALKEVHAVIHTATTMPGRGDTETVLKVAIEGSLNLLRQAEKAGVKHVVVTGSFAAVAGDPTAQGTSFRAEHWNPITKEDASNSPIQAYQAAKKFSELAVWEWAEAHPHVDVTTIIPPYLYGPFANLFQPIAPGDWTLFSTNIYISNLLSPTGKFPMAPPYADVRDTARAHIEAFKAPPNIKGRKRILIASPHVVVYKDLLDTIKKARPELSERLIQTPVPDFPISSLDLDYARIEEVLGIKRSDFHTLEQTYLDAIDAVLNVEREWKARGYLSKEVPAPNE